MKILKMPARKIIRIPGKAARKIIARILGKAARAAVRIAVKENSQTDSRGRDMQAGPGAFLE